VNHERAAEVLSALLSQRRSEGTGDPGILKTAPRGTLNAALEHAIKALRYVLGAAQNVKPAAEQSTEPLNTADQLLMGEIEQACDEAASGAPCVKCGRASIMHSFKRLLKFASVASTQPPEEFFDAPKTIHAHYCEACADEGGSLEAGFWGHYKAGCSIPAEAPCEKHAWQSPDSPDVETATVELWETLSKWLRAEANDADVVDDLDAVIAAVRLEQTPEIERLTKEAANARILMQEMSRCTRCLSCAQSARYHLVDFPAAVPPV
jgi:hypothetical protein